MLKVLDLFSGIGGFSLGLERAGMRTVAFCECDRYCRLVLRTRWPKVKCYAQVETLTSARLVADGIERPDLICGGFPCQDISLAGSGEGIEGERSGLWREFARIIRDLRPRFVLVENVSALRGRGLDTVLGNLAALRYDAEWHCIPAAAVGAPHARDRIWILAYTDRDQLRDSEQWLAPGWDDVSDSRASEFEPYGAPCALADANSGRREGERNSQYAIVQGPSGREPDGRGTGRSRHGALGDSDGTRSPLGATAAETRAWLKQGRPTLRPGPWSLEPDVGRVADGVPARVDRLKGLGNSLVPAIPELLGRAILRRINITPCA